MSKNKRTTLVRIKSILPESIIKYIGVTVDRAIISFYCSKFFVENGYEVWWNDTEQDWVDYYKGVLTEEEISVLDEISHSVIEHVESLDNKMILSLWNIIVRGNIVCYIFKVEEYVKIESLRT